jgi:hypothetical protein
LLSAFFDTNSPSIQRSFLSLKPFDAQDRIYKAPEFVGRLSGANPKPRTPKRQTPNL